MIFFDQFKVPTIKFGKRFAEFMIPIPLLKKFVVKAPDEGKPSKITLDGHLFSRNFFCIVV